MTARPALTISTLRIILMALIGGLVMITATVVVLRLQGGMPSVQPASNVLPIMTAIGLLTSVGLAFALRTRMVGEAAKSREESLQLLRGGFVPRMLGVATIAGAALFEGPGLLGAITVLLGGPWYCLAAPLLAIVGIAWMIPSRERLEESLR